MDWLPTSFGSPSTIYVSITIAVICMVKLVQDSFKKAKRKEVALKERELYYERVYEQSLKMNNELLEDIKKLKEEAASLEAQLVDEDSDSDTLEASKKELANLQRKKEQLLQLDEEISIDTDDEVRTPQDELEMKDKIKRIEQENEEIEKQLAHYPAHNLSDDLIWFLLLSEEEFLQQAYDAILEVKASNFKNVSEEEFADLQVAEKSATMKLQQVMEDCDREEARLIEMRAEDACKVYCAKQYLQMLRENNEFDEAEIQRIESEIETKQEMLKHIQARYDEAEKQYLEHYEAWKDIELKSKDSSFLSY